MNKRLSFTLCILTLLCATAFAQKKQLSIQDLATWRSVEDNRISNDGNWVVYSLKGEEGDGVLELWHATDGSTWSYERGEDGRFTENNSHLVFLIKPHEDSIMAMKRRKVKKDDLPADTVGILNLQNMKLEKIAHVRSFSVPEKWSGWVFCQMEAGKELETIDSSAVALPDSLKVAAGEEQKEKKQKPKKEGRKTGTRLLMIDLANGEQTPVPFVKEYSLAEEAKSLLIHTTGTPDSTWLEGVYRYDCEAKQSQALFTARGEYKSLSMDKGGNQAAWLVNLDSTETRVPSFGLCYWNTSFEQAEIIADSSSAFLPRGWNISEFARPVFSGDHSKLFFGMAPPPILQDTSLLDEEIVNVEVWSYTDGLLHTHQKTRLEREKQRSYEVVYIPQEGIFVPLADSTMPEITFGPERNGHVAIGYTEEPYQQLISWEGAARRDVWLVHLLSGERRPLATGLRGRPRISPAAKYAYWYSEPDSAWFAHSVDANTTVKITDNSNVPFYDELNDVPDYPNPYGIASWSANDEYLLIYDRFDIWRIDPTGEEAPVNLTNGRNKQLRYRYVKLDPEEQWVENGQRLLLHIFDEKTKESGYGYLVLGAGKPIQLMKEPFYYSSRPQKARDADRVLFTKENFQTFPDLRYSDLSFRNQRRISHANPQQADFSWGTAELYEWTSLNGETLQGILIKPEGFDPSKKYPMLVNFYERSSNRLHRHARPYLHRSSINYSYYASRGYVIFNPDVPYREGYPGESCLNAVVPGVTSLIDKGFIDKNRIGVQGHSWGGYQVAYLITKTDIFRCAESGAPVVNMFSAYGGIRWQTGLSRMFQYEHTQSRIGGTIWEYPLRYLENSPLFFLDKVNTPVLIMHNDNDGHVPWYQGIEFFVAMRRLGKPAWMLNYNNEPHWPLKLQNRKDFQTRMSQFFDYYLKDAPKPLWMERGIPAIEKGIRQGLEPVGHGK